MDARPPKPGKAASSQQQHGTSLEESKDSEKSSTMHPLPLQDSLASLDLITPYVLFPDLVSPVDESAAPAGSSRRGSADQSSQSSLPLNETLSSHNSFRLRSKRNSFDSGNNISGNYNSIRKQSELNASLTRAATEALSRTIAEDAFMPPHQVLQEEAMFYSMSVSKWIPFVNQVLTKISLVKNEQNLPSW